METSFNLKEYIKILGQELVSEFEKAGIMTHPGAVGAGRETSAKQKLKQILPAGVGVGSGFVIDSFGHTSRQCDIILYEENCRGRARGTTCSAQMGTGRGGQMGTARSAQ